MAASQQGRAAATLSTMVTLSLSFQLVFLVPLGLGFLSWMTMANQRGLDRNWCPSFGELYRQYLAFPGNLLA